MLPLKLPARNEIRSSVRAGQVDADSRIAVERVLVRFGENSVAPDWTGTDTALVKG